MSRLETRGCRPTWKVHPSGEVEMFVEGLYGSGSGVMLPNGHLLHTDFRGDEIVRVERDGTVHPFATEGLEGPVGITILGEDAYTVNAKSNWIARVSTDGTVSELVRDERLRVPNGITAGPDGNLYVVNLGNTLVLRVTPEGELTELATLPGTANGHIAYASGSFYVTQIWENVVMRVGMDGSYEVVAGDGTLRLRDGPTGESRTPFPNGITATRRGDAVYFNTLEGNMVSGHPGVIRVHKLHVPSPNHTYEAAWKTGGIDAMRSKFEAAWHIEGVTQEQLVQAHYGVASHLLWRGHVDAGLALIGWNAGRDENELQRNTQLGRAHLIHGSREVALESLQRASELAPENDQLKRLIESARTYRRNRP